MRKIFITLLSFLWVLSLGFGSLAVHYYQGLNQPSMTVFAQTDTSTSGEPGQSNAVYSDTGRDSGYTDSGRDSGYGDSGRDGGYIDSGRAPIVSGLQLENPLKYGTLCDVLTAIINIITQIGAVIAVILIIWTGFTFVIAQGRPEKLNEAKRAFFYTIIGTAVLLGASVIAQIVVKTIFSITNKGNPGICNI